MKIIVISSLYSVYQTFSFPKISSFQLSAMIYGDADILGAGVGNLTIDSSYFGRSKHRDNSNTVSQLRLNRLTKSEYKVLMSCVLIHLTTSWNKEGTQDRKIAFSLLWFKSQHILLNHKNENAIFRSCVPSLSICVNSSKPLGRFLGIWDLAHLIWLISFWTIFFTWIPQKSLKWSY